MSPVSRTRRPRRAAQRGARATQRVARATVNPPVAADLMTEAPAAIRATTSVGQALLMLQELDVRHLPVVNNDRELIGMVSDRDFRGLPISLPDLVEDSRVHLEAAVSTIMSADVLSVDSQAELPEIIDLMIENKVGAIPVVDPEGVLVGIVSYVDVLREYAKTFD